MIDIAEGGVTIIDNERTFAYNLNSKRVCKMHCGGDEMQQYLSIRETSEKWGLSVRRIQTLVNNGRIEGATRIGYMWVIPADAVKPKDMRVKSGKYVKGRKA